MLAGVTTAVRADALYTAFGLPAETTAADLPVAAIAVAAADPGLRVAQSVHAGLAKGATV